MSDSYRKPYIESSVFIAFIKGEQDQGPNHDQDAKQILDSIIDAAKAGVFPIITSALTIAEVFKNKKNPPLTDQQNEDLRPYFREAYLQIVEIDREVGDRANELCRTLPADATAGFKMMRPNDAIHIAAAERAECDVVLAWDPDFISQKPRISTVRLENPKIVTFAVPAEQSPMFENGATIEPAQQAPSAVAEEPTAPILVLPAAAGGGDEAPTVIANPSSVSGGDGGRSESNTSDEAPTSEEKKSVGVNPQTIEPQ